MRERPDEKRFRNVVVILSALGLGAGCEGGDWMDDNGAASKGEPIQAFQSLLTTPSDPLFAQQWHLSNTGQTVPIDENGDVTVVGTPGIDMNIRGLWDFTQGSRQMLVAVAETEDIFVDHEDLRGSIFENQDEIPGDGIDNDHNDCVDDVRGCDFRNGDGVLGPFDDSAHATHVAGLIGASIGNGKGVVGVAPKVKILPITAGYLFPDSLVRAIHYAERMGAQIFHMSQGSFMVFDTDVQAAIASSPMLFVFSAGNDGTFRYNYPSAFESTNIISVAEIDPLGELRPFSNFGPSVDLAAPGLGILSTLNPDSDNPQGGYGRMSGTSMAAPQVSGVAALLMNKLNLTVAQVKDRILRSGMKLTGLDGMVNSGAMLDALAAFTDVAPFTVSATSTPTSITLSWSSQGSGVRYDVERDGTVVSNGTSTSFTQANLATDSAHFYRVRAVVNGKAGLWTHRWMKRPVTMPTRVGAVGGTTFIRQSAHPYPNGVTQDFVLGQRNAKRLRAHFARIELEGDRSAFQATGDFLSYQPAASGAAPVLLHGTYPALWTDWQPGVFKFTLATDASGRRYGFAIDAYDYTVGIPDQPRNAPEILAATSSSVSLRLTFCPGATRVDLYRSTSSTSGFVRVRSFNRDLTTFNDTVSFVDSGLASNRTFFYEQTCVNDLGTSPVSNVASATTL